MKTMKSQCMTSMFMIPRLQNEKSHTMTMMDDMEAELDHDDDNVANDYE